MYIRLFVNASAVFCIHSQTAERSCCARTLPRVAGDSLE
jgi:hypothetical protein